MQKRTLLTIGGGLSLIVILALGYYLISPLFIDNSVDEAFPFAAPDNAAIAAMDESERAALEADFVAAVPDEATVAALAPDEQAAVEAEVQSAAEAVMMDKEMDDAMPDEPVMLSQGTFAGTDSVHQGSGSAAIYELPDGQRVLRFESFSVTNGPDLHVILVRNPDPAGAADVGDDYVDLGPLKGNLGNQNYPIPDDVDLSQYGSVVIYCVPFHVVFATAPLG